MACKIIYKGISYDESDFKIQIERYVAINNLFNENETLANTVYEALGFDNNKNLNVRNSIVKAYKDKTTIELPLTLLESLMEFDRAANPNRIVPAQLGEKDKLNPFNNIKEMTSRENIDRIKESITKNGFNRYLEISLNSKGALALTEGNHRLQALKELGYTNVPVKVLGRNTVEGEYFQMVENGKTRQYGLNLNKDFNNQITPKQKQQAQQLYSQYLDSLNTTELYSKLGNKTESGNVKIVKSIFTNKDNKDVITAFRVDKKLGLLESFRKYNAIGNPINWQDFKSRFDGDNATIAFIDWFLGNDFKTLEQEYRQEILNNLDNLKGKTIEYYKELGRPSHATALDYLINKLGSKQDIKGFKDFVQGKQFQKLTVEEKAKTIEQVTKEHRSIAALKDLAHKLAHRIGGKVQFENRTDVDWKGYNQGITSVLNEAYMTPDTPFHEILAHPIIRAIKNQTKNKQFYLSDGTPSSFGIYDKNGKIIRKDVNDDVEPTELYQSLLKELETGRGKEVLEQVKRDYKYRYNIEKTDSDYGNYKIKSSESGARYFDTYEEAQEALERYAGIKYTLEEQQEEAIVTLLGMMAADKLDAKKDATLISKLKELWKQISDFVKSLLRQDGIKIDELPITTTLNDLAEIMAYGNNKIILPGYKVEYSTPLGNKYDTLEEVNQEIRGLADANVEVDLNGVKVNTEDFIIPGYIRNFSNNGYYYRRLGDTWQKIKETDTGTEGDYENISLEETKIAYANEFTPRPDLTDINQFIEKNKEYEQSREIIEQWKKENNIHYDPEEVYSRGQGFYSSIGAYSNLELDLLFQNLLQHIEDNKKAGGEFTISAFTKPIDKRLKHIEGTGDRVRFVIYPQSEHIKWAAPTDVYSGSVWDAHEKVSKDKKSELLGVSYTKYPTLNNLNTIQPNLASIIDNLAHHHNELGIVLTGNNFRLEYDDDIPYSTKKIINGVNSILDQKYGKLIKPEISKTKQNNYNVFDFDPDTRSNVFLKSFDSKDKAIEYVKNTFKDKIYKDVFETVWQSGNYEPYSKEFNDEVNKSVADEIETYIKQSIGIQPTQTNETLKESIESVQSKLKAFLDYYVLDYDGNNWVILGQENEFVGSWKNKEDAEKELNKLQPKDKSKEYTEQALINTKIAKLKEVAKKYPRSLIRSKVVPINPNMVDNSEIQYSKRESIENLQNELNQLKQELERVETEGFGALRPIYNFYENTVTNILKKQYGKDNVKQITDEYGNTWNEITITPKMSETIRLNTPNGKIEYTGDLAIEEKIAEEAENSKDEKVAKTSIGKFIQSIRNLFRNLFKERDNISRLLRDMNQGRLNSDNSNNINQKFYKDSDFIINELTEKAFSENPNLSLVFTKEEYKKLIIESINKKESKIIPSTKTEQKIIDGKTVTISNKILPTVNEIKSFIDSLKLSDKKETKISILNYVISSTNNPKLKEITQLMIENIDLINDFSFIGLNNENRSRTALAKIDPTNGEISLFKNNLSLWNSDEILQGISHEFIHAFTLSALNNPKTEAEKQFRKEMTDIYLQLKSNTAFKNAYGFTKIEEFVTELATNAVFRYSIRFSKPTVWEKIVNSIKKFFGNKIKYNESEENIKLINKGFDEILNFLPLSSPQKSNVLGKFYVDKINQDIKYQLSKEQSDAIDNVFDENPELADAVTKEQYSQYLNTIFPDSKVEEMDNSLYISILNQLEQENVIEKHCTGGIKAENGLQTNFTRGGEWKLIKDLKGYPTHKEGGVDLTIGKNGVSIKNGNTEFTAKHGLVLPNNFGNPIEFEAMSKVLSQRNKHLNWVDRGLNPDKYPKIDNQDGTFSTHRLAYSTGDNGEAYVYPTIIQNDKGELEQLDDNAAWEYARETKTAMRIPSVKLAEYYSQNGLIKH